MDTPKKMYDQMVRGKVVIYLDHNMWIYLGDAETDTAKECRDVLLERVSRGTHIVPVSMPEMGELKTIPLELRQPVVDLAEKLSCNVTLRLANYIFDLESLGMYLHFSQNASPEEVKNWVRSFCYDWIINYGLTVQDNPHVMGTLARKALEIGVDPEAFLDFVRSETRKLFSVGSLVKMIDTAESSRESLEKFVNMFSNPQYDASLSREARLQAEQRYLFTEWVTPTIRRGLITGQLPLPIQVASNLNNERKALKRSFGVAPTLNLYANLMVNANYDRGRKILPQDFWDIEHSLYAPYVDIFVSEDDRVMGQIKKYVGATDLPVLLNSVESLLANLKM